MRDLRNAWQVIFRWPELHVWSPENGLWWSARDVRSMHNELKDLLYDIPNYLYAKVSEWLHLKGWDDDSGWQSTPLTTVAAPNTRRSILGHATNFTCHTPF